MWVWDFFGSNLGVLRPLPEEVLIVDVDDSITSLGYLRGFQMLFWITIWEKFIIYLPALF
jgi:hypothetical protein